jgi:hypothetical protein
MRMENVFLHLACGNNHDGIILILCIVLNLFFTSFFVSYIINYSAISYNYINIMWELYAQKAKENKC